MLLFTANGKASKGLMSAPTSLSVATAESTDLSQHGESGAMVNCKVNFQAPQRIVPDRALAEMHRTPVVCLH
jgi:hypothetical protein